MSLSRQPGVSSAVVAMYGKKGFLAYTARHTIPTTHGGEGAAVGHERQSPARADTQA